MSMSRRVLFAGSAPAVKDVQQALHDLGFDHLIDDQSAPLSSYDGFMPMKYASGAVSKQTGVEIFVGDAREFVEKLGLSEVDPRFDCDVSFRWGGDLHEALAAFALSAAIATVTGGSVFDDESGAFETVEETIAQAQDLLSYLST
jgi:hypothetical protein